MDFPDATITPSGAAYRIAEALMSPEVSIVGGGSVMYRLAGELGLSDLLRAEIQSRIAHSPLLSTYSAPSDAAPSR